MGRSYYSNIQQKPLANSMKQVLNFGWKLPARLQKSTNAIPSVIFLECWQAAGSEAEL